MTKGVLLFAKNNSQVDYVKQAYWLAKRINRYLELPVTLATDNVQYVKTAYRKHNKVFDNVVELKYSTSPSLKRYYDGSLSHKKLDFKNDDRNRAYEISPYDETLVLDTDFVISDNKLSYCFEQDHDFMIYKDAYDLANFRDYLEFKNISETSVEFYWATCVFFRKTPENKVFFDLLKHIKENWNHYRSIFQINTVVYRNDHAFSIAIHIMNGYQKGDFAKLMPGKLYYTTDKDVLVDIKNDEFMFLIEKEQYLGEYVPIKFKNNSVHVINKFSLNRFIDKELADD
jgi:hypothetical protein